MRKSCLKLMLPNFLQREKDAADIDVDVVVVGNDDEMRYFRCC